MARIGTKAELEAARSADRGPLVRLAAAANVVTGYLYAPLLDEPDATWVRLRGTSGSRFAVCLNRIDQVIVLECTPAQRPLVDELQARVAARQAGAA